MKYQLVLQWSASTIKNYDTLIEIENALIKCLDDSSEVDGHDAGSCEMNIFVHTNDPVVTFARIRASLGTNDFWVDARVAYRELSGCDYTVIWPENQPGFDLA